MTMLKRAARGAALMFLVASTACSATSGLGNILGGVLGGGTQVRGTVQNIDTRRQEISIRDIDNGRTTIVGYDNRTRVVYQNQTYSVNSLEYGDEVTANISQDGTNNNYTDYIEVNRSANGNVGGGGISGNVQSITGNVRQIDYQNGWFTLNTNNYGTVTVTLPYNPTRSDLTRFQNLRNGDYVRLYGTFLNNSRVELRNFY